MIRWMIILNTERKETMLQEPIDLDKFTIDIDTPEGATVKLDLGPYIGLLTTQLKPTEDSMFEMFVSGYNDIFGHNYIGYWAQGVLWDEENMQWLCYERPDHFVLPEDFDDLVIATYDQHIKDGWNGSKTFEQSVEIDGKKENVFCFVMDAEFACKAFMAAFRKWGQESIDNWDADTVDYAVQMALFEEVVYA